MAAGLVGINGSIVGATTAARRVADGNELGVRVDFGDMIGGTA